MLGVSVGRSPLQGVKRCHGCRRPDGAEVLAWANGRWAYIVVETSRCYVFEPWGEPCTDAEAKKQLTDPDFRTITVKLHEERGLCPRCAHTFPRRPRRAWRR